MNESSFNGIGSCATSLTQLIHMGMDIIHHEKFQTLEVRLKKHMAGIRNIIMLMKLLLKPNVFIVHTQSNENGTVPRELYTVLTK